MDANLPQKQLFYLQLENRLTDYFIEMAYLFNQNKVMLVPVPKEDFSYLGKNHFSLLCHTESLSSYNSLMKFKKGLFEGLLKKKGFDFYYLSSFGLPQEWKSQVALKRLTFFPLPVNTQDLVAQVSQSLHQKNAPQEKWDWGKRVSSNFLSQ